LIPEKVKEVIGGAQETGLIDDLRPVTRLRAAICSFGSIGQAVPFFV
jgi:hypothetical protein